MKSPRLPNRVLGLEWDADAVTVAVVVRDGAATVERLERFAVPADLPAEPAARGAWLAAALAGAHIAPGPAVAVLPRGTALWRRLTLPPGVGADRDAVIEHQTRRELPLPLDEVHAAWATDPAGGATLAAVRRAVVLDLERTHQAAGCALIGLVPGPVAALAVLAAARTGDAEPVLVLDVGHGQTEITAAAGGVPRLVRTVGIGAGHSEAADALAAELVRTRRALGDDPTQAPRRVWVAGDPGLAAALADRCDLPVAPLPAPGAVAAGAVLAAASEGARIDLLRPVIGIAPPSRRRVGRGVALAVAGVALLATLITPGLLVDSRASEAERLQAEADRLKKGEGAELQKLRTRIALLTSWTSERAHWIEVVRGLAEVVPEQKGVYLESLTLREGQPLSASARARNAGAVQEFLAALEAHARFSRVTPGRQSEEATRRGEHKIEFDFQAHCDAGAAE